MTIDFQGLLNVVKAAEAEQNFDMSNWECGTSHCMIGAFCTQNYTDRLQLTKNGFYSNISLKDSTNILIIESDACIATRFGITEEEASWLFIALIKSWLRCNTAMSLNKEQAIARLRKFIYYKLHKSEMTLEEGRRISGNLAASRAQEEVMV